MALRVYNTLTREKEDFQTVVPGRVGVYLCGPTVYKPAHIGHMVGPVIFDTIKRYLTWVGYDVEFVVNITDVDDKLIKRAAETGRSVEELAGEMTQDYFDNLELMGVDTIDRFPKATDHIPEMLEIIGSLVDSGHAYPLNGDVYFHVAQDEDYGRLSRRSVDEMMAGTRVEANDQKKNPADFALWKASKEREPAWDSKWGPGRPGWHIECSAMSMKYLGESFDIHGGGLDLLFPHHENEVAQSESFSGKLFAKYWMHNGLMRASGQGGKVGGDHSRHGDAAPSGNLVAEMEHQEAQKLAGSQGAESVRTAVFAKHHPETVRFFLLATHYRSPIDFSDERLQEVGRSLDGFYRLFASYERITGNSAYELPTARSSKDTVALPEEPSDLFEELKHLQDRFFECMDDDFNTGGAIGYLFEIRKCINGFVYARELTSGRADDADVAALTTALTALRELGNLLGVFRKPVETSGGADDEFVAQLMDLIIEVRGMARNSRQFELADRIRDRLTEIRVVLEDRTDGTDWRRD